MSARCAARPTPALSPSQAVVAALLSRAEAAAPGAVHLEAWPADVLPGFVRRPGLRSWRVADHVQTHGGGDGLECGDESDASDADEEVRLRWHQTFEMAHEAGMPFASPTLWPPTAATAATMHLERCSRILPHDQDTGGFFIALLRKLKPLPTGVGGVAGAVAGASTAPGSARAPEALPASGPASCRQLPPLDPSDELVPLPSADAAKLGQRHGLKAARKRLLRKRGAAGVLDEDAVRVAPQALAAFDATMGLSVVDAGVALNEHADAGGKADDS